MDNKDNNERNLSTILSLHENLNSVLRVRKSSIQLDREKPSWKMFEDRIWLLLHKFEFEELNSAYEPELQLPTKDKLRVRFDAIAKSDEFVFFVECKSKEELGSRSLLETIVTLSSYRQYLKRLVQEHYDNDYLEVVIVLAIENILLSAQEQTEANKKGIKIWDVGLINYLEQLANLTPKIGDAARYQLYAMMFPTKKHQNSSTVPAIQCHAGKITYYSFMATPEQLLKIAYVHRRGSKLQDAKNVALTYQRMLEPTKLKSISEYIDSQESLPFANSIIINFNEKINFDLSSNREDIKNGMLRLPRRYGSAWVIDGQHRLFGYAKSERRKNDLIPVIAFENISNSEQARLFVDINQNQKKVSANLLWDLKEDIYEGTTDKKLEKELIISKLGKKLASEIDSPLYKSVAVPSFPELSDNAPITLNTICSTIKSTGLLGNEYFDTNKLKVEDSVELIYAMLVEHFRFFAQNMSTDWGKGKQGFTRSSNGIAALIWIFRQTLHYLNYIEQANIYRTKSKRKEFSNVISSLYHPIKEQFEIYTSLSDTLRKKRGVSGQKESADQLCIYIKGERPDFPTLFTSVMTVDSNTDLRADDILDLAIRDTELKIRTLVMQRLKSFFGVIWYSKCLPGDVKQNINDFVENDIRKFPYKEKSVRSVEKRFDYVQLGDLKKVIVSANNWSAFEEVFKIKQNFISKMDEYVNLRNAFRGHPREIDDAQRNLGKGAMIWLNQCIDSVLVVSNDATTEIESTDEDDD